MAVAPCGQAANGVRPAARAMWASGKPTRRCRPFPQLVAAEEEGNGKEGTAGTSAAAAGAVRQRGDARHFPEMLLL
ncbi:unnamed protein product [Lampetra planeri]